MAIKLREHLCIGGPFDGETRINARGAFKAVGGPVPTYYTELTILADDTGKGDMSFWVDEDLDNAGVLRRLARAYEQQAKFAREHRPPMPFVRDTIPPMPKKGE